MVKNKEDKRFRCAECDKIKYTMQWFWPLPGDTEIALCKECWHKIMMKIFEALKPRV